MKTLEIIRLVAHIETVHIDGDQTEIFKEYCLKKLAENGFDLNKSIDFEDNVSTIIFTQEG